MNWRRLDHEREAQIEHRCIQAHVIAEDTGEPMKVVICAGAPCDREDAGCHWCTVIVVSPDGSRARTEAHFA